MKFYFEQPEGEWIEQGEAHLHIRFRPRNLLGIIIALLVHAFLLYLILTHHTEKTKQGGGQVQPPMVLILDQKTMNKMAQEAQPKKTQPKPAPKTPRAITPPRKSPPTPMVAREAPTPSPVPPAPSVTTAEPDMMSMLAAARQRRQAVEDRAKQENDNSAQSGRGMSPQEVAEANVRRSMQRANTEGTAGVFEIKSKGVREATFVFNGWKPTANNRWRQVIQVDAGLGGDINLAIIRRMIQLIRTYYTGDFSWESRRLGRVVTMSARPEDQASLEDFMMREFDFK
ncbi:MAG: cell envelope integrity protein TolA [Pseudomonadota bacterium]